MAESDGRDEQIDSLVRQLEKCFDDYVGGTSNLTALREVRTVLRLIESRCTLNSYAREKMHSIVDYSDKYFSSRKHQRVPGGANGCKVFILGDIRSLENALQQGRG